MTSILAPPRTTLQRRRALELANRIRTERSLLKRRLRAGEENAGDVLLNPPEWARTMKALDLLMALPRVGPVRAQKLLKRNMVSDAKTLGGLSTRQRWALVRELDRRG